MTDFAKLEQSLEKMIKQFKLEKTFQQSKAMELWDEVVGEKLAKKSKAEKFEHGNLFVKVESSAWRNEIQFHKEKIKQELNERLKANIVKKIIFI